MVAVFVAYYINGTGGILIAVCLVSALVISAVGFFAVRKKLVFKMKADAANLRKTDKFAVTLVLGKKTVLPTPYVEIRLKSSNKLSAVKSEIYKASLAFEKEPLEIQVEYSADFSGKAFVEIESVVLTDYLGLIKHTVFSCEKDEKIRYELNILPDIPQGECPSDLIKSAADAVGFDDGEEDSGETARFGGGMPGYEHRQYVPGDPVKKINWKLSSKRDVYLLRLDEKISVTNQIILFDVLGKNPDRKSLADADILIQGGLSLASSLIMQELKCDCWFYVKDSWNKIEVFDEKTLLELQRELGGYDCEAERKSRLPSEVKNEKGTSAVMIFTNKPDSEISSECEKLNVSGFYVMTENDAKVRFENQWIINELYEYKRV